jgi:hypothetical protein
MKDSRAILLQRQLSFGRAFDHEYSLDIYLTILNEADCP